MKKYKIQLLIVLTLALFSSCEKQVLNIDPADTENSDIYYNSEENCFKALVSCYRSMNLDMLYMIFGDIPTDDAVKGGSQAADGIDYQEVARYIATSSNVQIKTKWVNLYDLVTKTNELISGLDKQESLSDNKKIYLGEAKFLRAYAYSKLVLIYGRVPIFDHVVLPDEYESVKRADTEKEVFDFVKADLDSAIAVLPEKGNTDIGRVTNGAALALKAIVCLRETGYFYNEVMSARAPEYASVNVNDLWQDIYDLTNGVINSNIYTLLPNYAEVFELDGENGTETVFDQQYVNDLAVTAWDEMPGNEVVVRAGVRGFGGWGFNQPKDNLFHEFSLDGDMDPRRECTIISEEWPVAWGFDIVNDFITGTNASEYDWLTKKSEYDYAIYKSLRKGIPTSKVMPGGRRQIPANIRIIRYSDVLLMHAEAAYYLDKEQEARSMVNLVRERARNSTYPLGSVVGDYDADFNPINYRPFPNANVPDVVSSGEDLLQAIYHERRVEFAMEGIRYFDIIRTGQLDKLAYTDGYVSKKGLWPLPQNDVDNYGLQQNEEY